MADIETQVILSDSRTTVRNYAKGRILPEAFRFLQSTAQAEETPITVVWVPAYMGAVSPTLTNLNETAHCAARDILYRYGTALAVDADKDRLTSYNEITEAFCLGRDEVSLRLSSYAEPKLQLAAATW